MGNKTKSATGKNGSSKGGRPNRITEVVLETAKGFYEAGLMDQKTMREFEALCMPKVPAYTARQVKAIRAKSNCSQAVFAAYLNVSASSLRQWEAGTKKPAGIACKLLNIVETKGLDVLA